MVKKKNNFEEQVLTGLKGISSKLLDHDKKFANHDDKFNKVMDKLSDHDDKFNRVIDKLLDQDERFKKYDLRFDELKDFMSIHFDKIYGKLEKLEQEVGLLTFAVKKLEERMESTEKKLGDIEGLMVTKEELSAVKQQTLDLLKRIESLEAKVGA